MNFCGHEPFCAEFGSELALQVAKENVEKHYAVVGLVENINGTLKVLENELPEIFKVKNYLFPAFQYVFATLIVIFCVTR